MNKNIGISPLTDFLFHQATAKGIPLSGTFELTPECNFSCRMCYVRKNRAEVLQYSDRMFSIEQWLAIAEKAVDMGMLNLLLTGGEPIAYPGFWNLYRELAGMGLLLSINTNGSFIDEKAVDELLENPPRRINITLYGAGEETYQRLCGVKGAYEKVDKAINLLTRAGLNLKLNCSLTPWNAGDLEEMVLYAEDKGLILDSTSYMFPPLRRDHSMIGKNQRFTPEEAAKYRLKVYELQHTKEKYREFLKKISAGGSLIPPGLEEDCVDAVDGKVRCRAGKACFWITWDGYMTPCGMMAQPKEDLYGMSFPDAWEKTKNHVRNMKLSGICRECADKDLCHSCAAMAQTETGNFSGVPTYLCEMIEAMKILAKEGLEQI